MHCLCSEEIPRVLKPHGHVGHHGREFVKKIRVGRILGQRLPRKQGVVPGGFDGGDQLVNRHQAGIERDRRVL